MSSEMTDPGKQLFAGVSDTDLEIVVEHCTKETFLAGDSVFKEGDEGDTLFIVESGLVEIYKIIRGDVDRVLGTIGPGEIFGEMTFIDGSRRSAGARTVEPSALLTLSRASFNKLAEKHPGVAAATFAALAQILAERLRHQNEAYKESVSAYLEATGVSRLNLQKLVEGLRPVTVHLNGGGSVTGRLLDLENQAAGWALFMKDASDKVSLIPYHAVVRIEVN